MEDWAQGEFTFKNDSFYYKGEPIPSRLHERIAAMATEGKDPTVMFRFWERLKKNPSWRSVQQLFSFLDHEHIPLTKDGCFLAYKKVRSDYKDSHSGKWDNSPGAVNEMPRNEISDDPQQACHVGFHVGALRYAKGFTGEKMVICKVDPEHVVCVPYDSSQEKMRVCKYKVVGVYSGQPLDSLTFDDYEELEPVSTPPLKEPTSSHRAPNVRHKAKGGFAKFDKKTLSELMECTLDDLRQYAGKGLNIVGASKIAGGKTALVRSIMKVRG